MVQINQGASCEQTIPVVSIAGVCSSSLPNFFLLCQLYKNCNCCSYLTAHLLSILSNRGIFSPSVVTLDPRQFLHTQDALSNVCEVKGMVSYQVTQLQLQINFPLQG